MKKANILAGLVLTVAFLFAGSVSVNAETGSEKKVTFSSNMNCAACQGKVETSLKDLAGVVSYKADLTSNTVTVEFDSEKTSEDKIKSAINEAGFKADKKANCETGVKKTDCNTDAKKSDCDK